MSNLILNLRFGAYHFQIVRWGDWRLLYRMKCWFTRERAFAGSSPISLSYNPYQADNSMTRDRVFSREAWKSWFEVC